MLGWGDKPQIADVEEAVLAVLRHLVQKRVREAQGAFALVHEVIVDEREQPTKDRATRRSAAGDLPLPVAVNEDVVSSCRNIWKATVAGVKRVLRRLGDRLVGQIRGDGGLLKRQGGRKHRKSTTSREAIANGTIGNISRNCLAFGRTLPPVSRTDRCQRRRRRRSGEHRCTNAHGVT
jgi:hypothetical protein